MNHNNTNDNQSQQTFNLFGSKPQKKNYQSTRLISIESQPKKIVVVVVVVIGFVVVVIHVVADPRNIPLKFG